MSVSNSCTLFQTAFYVQDIEKAVYRWNRLYGAGPFVVLHHYKMEKLEYRGRQLDKSEFPDLSYALGYLGDLMIQFTAQDDDNPSVYRDMYRRGQEGFHHVAYLTATFEQEVQRLIGLGFDVGMRFEVDGAEGAYVDTRTETGCFTEIHSNPKHLTDAFAEWRRAHALHKPGDKLIINQ
jgi:Glyoxalase/Bleomycin resistance protein/Dioxygenase superfamily